MYFTRRKGSSSGKVALGVDLGPPLTLPVLHQHSSLMLFGNAMPELHLFVHIFTFEQVPETYIYSCQLHSRNPFRTRQHSFRLRFSNRGTKEAPKANGFHQPVFFCTRPHLFLTGKRRLKDTKKGEVVGLGTVTGHGHRMRSGDILFAALVELGLR